MSTLRSYRFRFKAMGSPCEIRLYAPNAKTARAIQAAGMADIDRLEGRYSRFDRYSLLSEINRVAAQGGSLCVDPETAALLDYARTCHEQSDGLFDITTGALQRLWRSDADGLPEADMVQRLRERVGWQHLCWNPPRLSFDRPGLELDLGGIVKEYAADHAAATCRDHGAEHGLVNLGGDIRVIGPHPDGTPWSVAVAHPRQANSAWRRVSLSSGAIASSGDYARCRVVNGVRYGHLLNIRTGWPTRHLAAVTVMAEHCVVAGSASTIAMLKDQDGPRWLGELGVPHLWMDVYGRTGGSL
ncbi:MAG: FAD:protein FMN transferase [Gammaproteobacteria bacterium]|nr:FAD:protein FMN transferase [Gammaproteobacteria bacterium]